MSFVKRKKYQYTEIQKLERLLFIIIFFLVTFKSPQMTDFIK